MKITKIFSLILILNLLFVHVASHAGPQSCQRVLNPKSSATFFQDELLAKMGLHDARSIVRFGQQPLERSTYLSAVNKLVSEADFQTGLTLAYSLLTGARSKTQLRNSESHILGRFSERRYHILTDAQIKNIEQNPFLIFEPASDFTGYGALFKGFQVGSIRTIDSSSVKQNLNKFPSELRKEISPLVAKNLISTKDLVATLLEWSLREAQTTIKNNSKSSPQTLALLEWRIKSLGLYDKPLSDNADILSQYKTLLSARSHEISEAIVDALAIRRGLAKEPLYRGIRPELFDSIEVWTAYMSRAMSTKESQVFTDFESLAKGESSNYQAYLLSRSLLGESLSSSKKSQYKKEYDKIQKRLQTAEPMVTNLIPLDYIANFGQNPKSYSSFVDKYFHQNMSLFRGVSNPRKMPESDVLSYFSEFKGRLASEQARLIFADREKLAQLSMLQYNMDLLSGKLAHVGLEHASKHLAYKQPNMALSYLVSTTTHDTVAFRFAADKGYVSTSSSEQAGNTHFVIESMMPKQGALDFSNYRSIDEAWRNYFPRQKEVAVAGGIDPWSIIRIYEIKPHAQTSETVTVGPEKHGEILRIYERDLTNHKKILLKEKNKKGEWVIVGDRML